MYHYIAYYANVRIFQAEYNLHQLRKSSYWEYEQARLNFWHQCNSDFHKAGVEPEAAADFFQVDLGKVTYKL